MRSTNQLTYIDFYCFLIWPFIETYWLATVSLFIIATVTPPRTESQQQNDTPNAVRIHPPPGVFVDAEGITWVDERIFLKKAQSFGKTLYYQGK
jgi:hypothetical protein